MTDEIDRLRQRIERLEAGMARQGEILFGLVQMLDDLARPVEVPLPTVVEIPHCGKVGDGP